KIGGHILCRQDPVLAAGYCAVDRVGGTHCASKFLRVLKIYCLISLRCLCDFQFQSRGVEEWTIFSASALRATLEENSGPPARSLRHLHRPTPIQYLKEVTTPSKGEVSTTQCSSRRYRKSCRLRWLNYLKPNIKKGAFQEDEVDLIIRLHRLLGNRSLGKASKVLVVCANVRYNGVQGGFHENREKQFSIQFDGQQIYVEERRPSSLIAQGNVQSSSSHIAPQRGSIHCDRLTAIPDHKDKCDWYIEHVGSCKKGWSKTGRSCTSCMVHHEEPDLITQRSERQLAIEKLLLQEIFSSVGDRLAQSWLIWVTPCQEEGEEDGKQTDRLIQASIIVHDGMDLCLVAWILWPDEESRYSPNLEKVVKKRLTSEVAAAASRDGRWRNQMRRAAHDGCCRRVAQIRALTFILWAMLVSENLIIVLADIENPLKPRRHWSKNKIQNSAFGTTDVIRLRSNGNKMRRSYENAMLLLIKHTMEWCDDDGIKIEEIATKHIDPVGQSSGVETPSTVIASIIEESLATVAHIEGEQEESLEQIIPNIPAEDVNMEESQESVILEVVAAGHSEDLQMEDTPFQGEPETQKEAEIQGEPTVSAPVDKYEEGLVESTSDGDDSDDVDPVAGSTVKGKGVGKEIPLLTRKAHRRSKNKKILVHLKPIIERLNAQGEILCSIQSDISSIFSSQSTGVKEIGAVKAELQGMNSELGSLKKLVSYLSDFVRAQLSTPTPPAPTQPVLAEPDVGPSGPVFTESRPLGPVAEEVIRPTGLVEEKSGPQGPSGLVESEAQQSRTQEPVEAVVVPPEPPASSPLQTPSPPSPPSSSTAPPAPETFKQPLPKHTSSTTSSTSIPPPPIFEDAPGELTAAALSAARRRRSRRCRPVRYWEGKRKYQVDPQDWAWLHLKPLITGCSASQ
ncbi:hypothetical protein Taro_046767, partial [Colocasia esculenta]|nr:hypothetical protein [Colocasia esculenta]